jgi:hypothetical protein
LDARFLKMEPDDYSNLILANAFRRLNRPYLALIGLVINLICFYKHWSYRHYVLNFVLKSSYKFVFTCNFITIALDHFAVQVFLETYLSQTLSCQIMLVISDLIFCCNLSLTISFILAALKLEIFYLIFGVFTSVNCMITMNTIAIALPTIPKEKDALICGFVTVECFSPVQICLDVLLLCSIIPIIYKLYRNLSGRFPIRSLSFWCPMLSFSALTLAADLLLIFHWMVEISTHEFLLANEIAEFVAKTLGWILLPMFMMCVQFGFPFQTKRIEEIPEVVLEMNDLEPFTFQRKGSDATLRSEV